MSYAYDPARGKQLLKTMDPGFVRIIGIPSMPDTRGYSGWIEIEQDVEDERRGDAPGVALRVNPGLVELPTRSRIYYGGGINAGVLNVETTRRPYVRRVHKLTQYIRQRNVGTPIPTGAYGLEVSPGGHGGTNPIMFDLMVNAQVLAHVDGAVFQEFYPIGTATTLFLLSVPVPSQGQQPYFQLDWHIDV